MHECKHAQNRCTNQKGANYCKLVPFEGGAQMNLQLVQKFIYICEMSPTPKHVIQKKVLVFLERC